jgi:mannosyltransferase OCH1-like enzyme
VTCIQGSFTNEHFQYIDRPRSKWTHVDNQDLLK